MPSLVDSTRRSPAKRTIRVFSHKPSRSLRCTCMVAPISSGKAVSLALVHRGRHRKTSSQRRKEMDVFMGNSRSGAKGGHGLAQLFQALEQLGAGMGEV